MLEIHQHNYNPNNAYTHNILLIPHNISCVFCVAMRLYYYHSVSILEMRQSMSSLAQPDLT